MHYIDLGVSDSHTGMRHQMPLVNLYVPYYNPMGNPPYRNCVVFSVKKSRVELGREGNGQS